MARESPGLVPDCASLFFSSAPFRSHVSLPRGILRRFPFPLDVSPSELTLPDVVRERGHAQLVIAERQRVLASTDNGSSSSRFSSICVVAGSMAFQAGSRATSSSERDPNNGVLGSPPDEAGRSACLVFIRPVSPVFPPSSVVYLEAVRMGQ